MLRRHWAAPLGGLSDACLYRVSSVRICREDQGRTSLMDRDVTGPLTPVTFLTSVTSDHSVFHAGGSSGRKKGSTENAGDVLWSPKPTTSPSDPGSAEGF